MREINEIAEHDEVVLTGDLPNQGLSAGDVGTVVSIHEGESNIPSGYTLEFFTLVGETIGVVNVEASAVRPVSERDVHSARAM